MKCLWLEDQALRFRSDIPIPAPGPSQALIRMRLAGVCSTDLELVRGYYPFSGIPGHEFVGEVVSCPSDITLEGKRVVGEINIACGACPTCLSGLPRHCERRKVLGIHDWNGVFAQYLLLPISNLHQVPDSVSDQAAVFTEPLAAACEILDQVQIRPTDKVLIIGAGRLGQLAAQVLQVSGCNLEVATHHPKQEKVLASRNIRFVRETELGGAKYDVVIEATGNPGGFQLAQQLVRPRGTIVLKSTYKGNVQVDFSSIVVNEITLVGSRCGSFTSALELLAAERVDPLPLIEAVFPLDQAILAFEQAGKPGVLKVLIQSG